MPSAIVNAPAPEHSAPRAIQRDRTIETPLRTAMAEPVISETRERTTSPVQQIDLRVSSDRHEKVDVRLVAQGEEVRIAVRSAHPELAQGLREDLGSLVKHLENNGYQTEAWRPAAHVSTSSEVNPGKGDDQPSAFNGDRDPQHGGSGSEQEREGRRGRREDQQPWWVEQLEEGFARMVREGRETEWSR
jgi:hypothetical protein